MWYHSEQLSLQSYSLIELHTFRGLLRLYFRKASKKVDKSKKSKRRGRKRKDCSESDSSESVLSDKNPDDDAQSVHSSDLRNPDVHDSDLSYQPKAVESELFPNNDWTQEIPPQHFAKQL